jgi:hypothetical protein
MKNIHKVLLFGGGVVALLLIINVVSAEGVLLPAVQIPDHLKLKVPKDRLLGSAESNGVVKYAYRSDARVDDSPSAEAIKKAQGEGLQIRRELLDRRTKHARTFETDKDGTYISEIIGGEPQYYRDFNGEWWQAEYATTTKEAFDQQTAPSILGTIFNFKKALADSENFSPDSTGLDGYLNYGKSGASWSYIHDASSNADGDSNTVDYTWEKFIVRAVKGTNYQIGRAFVLFNTSILPDSGYNIDSASLSLYATSTVNTGNDGYDYISVLLSSPAATSSLIADDWDQAGSTEQHDSSERKDITNIGLGYVTWNLNATGIGNISLTGVTKFGVREGHDLTNNAIGQDANNDVAFSSSEATVTDQDPKLIVMYSVPPPPFNEAYEVRKTTNESVMSSTILQADDALVLGLAPNKSYIIEGVVFASSTNQNPDIKIAWGFDQGVSGITADLGYVAGGASTFLGAELIQASSTPSQRIQVPANATPVIIKISGTVVVGSASSTLSFLWSQFAANASPTTVLKGSYLKADAIQ